MHLCENPSKDRVTHLVLHGFEDLSLTYIHTYITQHTHTLYLALTHTLLIYGSITKQKNRVWTRCAVCDTTRKGGERARRLR